MKVGSPHTPLPARSKESYDYANPRSPMPSGDYMRKRRTHLGLPVQGHAQLVRSYEDMRERLAYLTAKGVIINAEPIWRDETLGTHCGMASKHFRRAGRLLAQAAFEWWEKLWETPPPSKPPLTSQYSTELQTDDPGPNEDGMEGSPTVASLSRRCLIMPIGTWKEKWDLFVLTLIFYSALVVPVRVCFDADAVGWVWCLEVTMTFCFIFDVLLSFQTVFFDSTQGKWVTSRWLIARAYLRGWFWIDVPSSVPVEIISLYVDAQSLSMLRVLRMIRLIRRKRRARARPRPPADIAASPSRRREPPRAISASPRHCRARLGLHVRALCRRHPHCTRTHRTHTHRAGARVHG